MKYLRCLMIAVFAAVLYFLSLASPAQAADINLYPGVGSIIDDALSSRTAGDWVYLKTGTYEGFTLNNPGVHVCLDGDVTFQYSAPRPALNLQQGRLWAEVYLITTSGALNITVNPTTCQTNFVNSTLIFDGSAHSISGPFVGYHNITVQNGATVTCADGIGIKGNLNISSGSFSPAGETFVGNVQIGALGTLNPTTGAHLAVGGTTFNNDNNTAGQGFVHNNGVVSFMGNPPLQTVTSVNALTFNELAFSGGQVGWWRFESNIDDFSGFNNTATFLDGTPFTPSSAPCPRVGYSTKSMQFDGATSLRLEPKPWMGTEFRTVSAWVWRDTAGSGEIYSDWDLASGRGAMRLFMDGGIIKGSIRLTGVGSPIDLIGPTLPENTWTHVALSFSGTGSDLFVNGVSVASDATAGELERTGLIKVIGAVQNGGARTYFLQSRLDDVRIYMRGLNNTEILTIMHARPAASGAITKMNASITVNGNLTITEGASLNTSDFSTNVTCKGAFRAGGLYTPGTTSAVIMAPTAAPSAIYGPAKFAGLTIDGPNTVQSMEPIQASTLTINSGTFTPANGSVFGTVNLVGGTLGQAADSLITVMSNWAKGAGSYTPDTGAKVNFRSENTWSITAGGSNAFNNLWVNAGPIGYWPIFGDNIDQSGNGLPTSLPAAPTFDTTDIAPGNYQYPDAAARTGCMVLNGSTNAMVNSNALLDELTGITVSAWIKPNNLGSDQAIITKHNGTAGWSMSLTAAGELRFNINNEIKVTAGSGIRNDEWRHVLFTVTPVSPYYLKIYLDGQLFQTEALSTGLATNVNALYMGYCPSPAATGLMGRLDDVRIYDRELSAEEVKLAMLTHPLKGGGGITLNGDITVSEDLAIRPGGSLTAGTGTLFVVGSMYNQGTFAPGSGTVEFAGANPQYLKGASSTPFNILNVDKSAGALILGSPVTVGSTLNLMNGTLDNNTNTVTMAANSTLKRTGGSIALAPSATTMNLEYGSSLTTGPELIPGLTELQNLTISSGTVVLASNATVNGTLNVGTGSTLNIGSTVLTWAGSSAAVTGTITSNADGEMRYSSASASQPVLAGTYGKLTFNSQIKSISPAGPIVIQGAFTAPTAGQTVAAGTTFRFTGSGVTIPNTVSYCNLEIAGTGTKSLAGGTTLDGNLKIENGAILASNNWPLVVAGNWTNLAGTSGFAAGNAVVTLNGVNQTIEGDTTFYNLSKNSSTAAVLTFTAGSTQTILNGLTLQGIAGFPLLLRSSTAGGAWNINATGVTGLTLNYLDIQDSSNTGTAFNVVFNNCVDSWRNKGWFFVPPNIMAAGNAHTLVVMPGGLIRTYGATNNAQIPAPGSTSGTTAFVGAGGDTSMAITTGKALIQWGKIM
ncbi:MAG: LamG-like jellyroll fold domain-containing protein [Solirubrobacterales bacterium]